MSAAACGRSADTSREPPTAEFLFASGDSTYWVHSSAAGLRVRSAPILLTQVDDRFFEVFIAEDGVDYEDAAFAVARVFAREVTRRDSLSLFDDGSVMREAEAWKRRHPKESAIDPESDDVPTDPRTVVSEEIEILDVHGPWVTLNHLLDIDLADREPHRHVGKRFVVDVRTGQRATLGALFGDAEAQRLIAAARQSFAQLTDSIRRAGDDRAALARESLESFKFDSSSFGLTDIAREPAVAFLIPGNGSDGEALALNLPPIAAQAPAWWRTVQPTLPTWAPDSSRVRWTRRGYEVVARPTDEGESLALSLVPLPARANAEWPIATVPAPAYQLIPLDAPAVSAAMHDALARAFDASSTLDGVSTAAGRHWFAPRSSDARHRRVFRTATRRVAPSANSRRSLRLRTND
ncbi:MAG: hypothetical protein IPP90_04710 [Gemmatimonadaceae bacterium]|nr:hypothetical protein [Gemmatimonadaceae bacterium]